MSNETSSSVRQFSPFWAIVLIVVSLLFLNIAQLTNTFNQRSQIIAAKTEMEKNLPKAQFINQTFEALGRDLLALAPSNQTVAKLVQELGLRQNPAAPAPAK